MRMGRSSRAVSEKVCREEDLLEPHDSVHKADGASVTQHVEIRVADGRVTCLINNVIVTTLEKQSGRRPWQT